MKNFTVVLTVDKTGIDGKKRSILVSVNIGKQYSMLDLLSDTIKFAEVRRCCDIEIDEMDGYPVVIHTPVTDESKNRYGKPIYCFELPAVYPNIAAENTDYINRLKKALFDLFSKNGGEYEDIDYGVTVLFSQIKPYFSGELLIHIEYQKGAINYDRHSTIKEAIDKINLMVSATSKYVSPVLNESVKQEEPSDKFFIKLPDYEKFKGGWLVGGSLIPALSSIWVPFAHPAYYCPYWKRLKNSSYDFRVRFLSSIDQENDISFDKKYITEWVDYPDEYILGNSENDELPIMDNEIDYYNTLLKFIEFDLKQNYSPEIAEKLLNEGGLTPEMEEFLDELLERILSQNWSCAGMFRIGAYSGNDDDEEDLREDDGSLAEYRYYKDTNERKFDGMAMIEGFIKKIAHGDQNTKPGGCKTYVEAIIKLARWGERKPANLKLDGSEIQFSLTRFSACKPAVKFDELVTKTVNGRPLCLQGYITLNWKLSDSDYISTIGSKGSILAPVGFIAVKKFEGDTDLSQIVYISLMDVIYEYLSGNQFINGIDLNKDGIFTVDNEECSAYSDSLANVIHTVESSPSCIVYVTKHLEDIAKDVSLSVKSMTDLFSLAKASNTPGSIFSKWFSRLPAKNKMHLLQIDSDRIMQPMSLMYMSVLKYVLPVYMKYSDIFKPIMDEDLLGNNKIDFSKALNIFYDVSQSLSMTGSAGFYSVKSAAEEVEEANHEIVQKLQTFCPAQAPKDSISDQTVPLEEIEVKLEDSKSEENPYILNVPVPEGEYKPLVFIKKVNGEGALAPFTIGYVKSVKLKIDGEIVTSNIICSVDELSQNDEVAKARFININSLLPSFLLVMGEMIAGNNKCSKARIVFFSKATINKLLYAYLNCQRD